MGDTIQTGAPPELYPGHAAEAAARTRHLQKAATAAVDPLPGPLLDAFTTGPQTVAGFSIRPLVHYDFVILRQLNSPLIAQLQATAAAQATPGAPPPRTPFTDQDAYEVIYLLTRPCREAAAMLAQGAERYRAVSAESIGMVVGPVDMALLVRAIEREVVRAFSTALSYEPRESNPPDGTQVFPQPPAPHSPTTALAGGSMSSAACCTGSPGSPRNTSSTTYPQFVPALTTVGPSKTIPTPRSSAPAPATLPRPAAGDVAPQS
jgi:hypothetical protein